MPPKYQTCPFWAFLWALSRGSNIWAGGWVFLQRKNRLEGNFPSQPLLLKCIISWEQRPGKGQSRQLSPGGKIFPLRENSPNFPLEDKFCPKRVLGEQPGDSLKVFKVPMGLGDDEIVAPRDVPDDLVCAICLDTFQDPVHCVDSPCPHTYCQQCILETLTKLKEECPTCRRPSA